MAIFHFSDNSYISCTCSYTYVGINVRVMDTEKHKIATGKLDKRESVGILKRKIILKSNPVK